MIEDVQLTIKVTLVQRYLKGFLTRKHFPYKKIREELVKDEVLVVAKMNYQKSNFEYDGEAIHK
eukprot:CAMPEP_0202961038 /NCGR_PEP_ID=MMETSP1396-20130829/5136_1 /ASSEMBLY_ACC=CAM_ASM_000872 /TAXON_ID= /ORGANISM="Pseudokeronopsis sp., Strain Brazil" /LENGTH=63 /DNA_ID=CAMNT_0049680611 /DNA_START=132 /DNA_END=323 /DNA_ORIENTATION=-